jgi:hypothetical protein
MRAELTSNRSVGRSPASSAHRKAGEPDDASPRHLTLPLPEMGRRARLRSSQPSPYASS